MNPLPTAISLVMRSYNEFWALKDTLPMVFAQDYAGTIELIVVDSGSTDGSIELIESHHPAEFVRITPKDYVPGRVLNRGLARASHEWVVFLNSDATPADRRWLPELLQTAVDTPKLGAAFSRQIPRPDCQAVFAHDYDRCFGPQRDSVRWDHFFSMVSCVVHRPTWERVPFREDLQYAEDDEWSRRLAANGYMLAFAEKSIAIHSHNYTVKQAYRRARGDAKAMAATSTTLSRHVNLRNTVFLSSLRDWQRDLAWLAREKRLGSAFHALAVRVAQRFGKWKGFHEGRALYHPEGKGA